MKTGEPSKWQEQQMQRAADMQIQMELNDSLPKVTFMSGLSGLWTKARLMWREANALVALDDFRKDMCSGRTGSTAFGPCSALLVSLEIATRDTRLSMEASAEVIQLLEQSKVAAETIFEYDCFNNPNRPARSIVILHHLAETLSQPGNLPPSVSQWSKNHDLLSTLELCTSRSADLWQGSGCRQLYHTKAARDTYFKVMTDSPLCEMGVTAWHAVFQYPGHSLFRVMYQHEYC